MPLHLISPLLLRAPLLPARALERAAPVLARHPLGEAAIALASPDLAEALARARASGPSGARARSRARTGAEAALDRYARRAAFRPTPGGLLAGVAVAQLAARTRVATGAAPEARLAPSWGRLAALGRALLDEPAVRRHVRLRVTPSVLRAEEEVVWLALERDGLAVRTAAVDLDLAAVLEVAADWRAWPVMRAFLAGATDALASDDDLDEHLLQLIDAGLLCHDLAPPLCGRPPPLWMSERLTALPPAAQALVAPLRAALAQVDELGARAELAAARDILARLPGADLAPHDLAGTLRLRPRRPATVSGRAVERAAALAPLLFALQEGMAAPVAERLLDPALHERLAAIAEVLGAGALDLEALATGGYGVRLDERPAPPPPPASPPPALLAHVVEALAAAAAAGSAELGLDPTALAALVPATAAPPTFELFLAPAREPPGAAPGTGWLLGTHAPAGASLGRFAAALGPPLGEALAAIAAHEGEARPGERALDVVYAPSQALADLCVHAPVRAEALALCGWPEGPAITPAALALVVDEAAAEPLALRDRAGAPVAPAPLHRVRSTTAPPGLYRLLAGWSFARQHAPWAWTWGPLVGLDRLPRVVLDGFVIAPASWRVPDAATLARPAALARWRRRAGVPALVQVGEGDELLPIDLRVAGAAAELRRFAGGRAFEIWPPLDRGVDRDGRRVELVAVVVDRPDPADAQASRAAIQATRAAGRIPPPAEAPPAAGWITLRIYGAVEQQDAVLFEAVAPVVAAARAAREIDRWFFLPYVDPGGQRDHLRVRARARVPRARGHERFARRLERALAPLRARGDVTTVERAEYFPERARYGGPALMPTAERLFEAGSELALRLLALEHAGAAEDSERAPLVARALDALAAGCGLDLAARHALAQRRRSAFAAADGEDEIWLRSEVRRHGRALAAHLRGEPAGAAIDPTRPALARFSRAVAAAVRGAPRALRAAIPATLPAHLHLVTVRLAGAHPALEQLATVLWERALAGLIARGAPPSR